MTLYIFVYWCSLISTTNLEGLFLSTGEWCDFNFYKVFSYIFNVLTWDLYKMFLNVRKFILSYHSRGDVNNIEADMAPRCYFNFPIFIETFLCHICGWFDWNFHGLLRKVCDLQCLSIMFCRCTYLLDLSKLWCLFPMFLFRLFQITYLLVRIGYWSHLKWLRRN